MNIDDLCPWLNSAETTTSPPTTTTDLSSLMMSRIREGDDLSEVTRPDSRRPTQAPATLKPKFVRVPDAETEVDRPQQDSDSGLRKYERCDLELRQSQRQRVVLQERWSNCSSAYTESVRDQESTLDKLNDCTEKLQEGQTNNQAAFKRVSDSEAECKRSLADSKDVTEELRSSNDKHQREIAASQASLKLNQKLKAHAERDLEVCLKKTDETNRQLGICEADKTEAQSAASDAQQCRREKADLSDRLTSEVETCQQQKVGLENRISSVTSEARKEKEDFENRLTECQDDVAKMTSSNSAIARERETASKQLTTCRANLDDAARAKSDLESAGETNRENLEKLADKYDGCFDESRQLKAKVSKLNDKLVLCEEQKSDMQYTLVQAEALFNRTEAGETVLATTAHPETTTPESSQCQSTLKAVKDEKDELTLMVKSCNGHLSSCKTERSALQLTVNTTRTSTAESCQSTQKKLNEEKNELTLAVKSCNGHLSSCKTERSALQITVNMTRPCLSEKAQLQSRLNVCKDSLEESNKKLSKANQELTFHKEQGFDMKFVNATTELQRCYKALNDALGSPVENRRLQENMGLANMPELNNFISLSQKSSACSGNTAKRNPPMWLNPAHLWTAIGLLSLACLGLAGVLVWKEFSSDLGKSPAQDRTEPVGPAQPLLPAVQARPQPVQARPATQAQPQEVVSAGKDQVEIHV